MNKQVTLETPLDLFATEKDKEFLQALNDCLGLIPLYDANDPISLNFRLQLLIQLHGTLGEYLFHNLSKVSLLDFVRATEEP